MCERMLNSRFVHPIETFRVPSSRSRLLSWVEHDDSLQMWGWNVSGLLPEVFNDLWLSSNDSLSLLWSLLCHANQNVNHLQLQVWLFMIQSYVFRPVLSCPYYAPYECGDGSCAVLPKHCPYIQPCRSNQVQCSDRTCADSYNECLYTTASCPVGSPIKCPDGRCVRNGAICTRKKCPDYAPCTLLSCLFICRWMRFWKMCFKAIWVSPISLFGQPSQLLEWSCICFCSCLMSSAIQVRLSAHQFLLVQRPSRCVATMVSALRHLITALPELLLVLFFSSVSLSLECPLGETLCTDGICRASCSNYFGCSLNHYMCSNSTCVSMDGYDMTTAFNLSSVCTNSCIGGSMFQSDDSLL